MKVKIVQIIIILLAVSTAVLGCSKPQPVVNDDVVIDDGSGQNQNDNGQQEDPVDKEEIKYSENGEIDTSDWRVYRSDEGGFEFLFPNNWEYIEVKQSDLSLSKVIFYSDKAKKERVLLLEKPIPNTGFELHKTSEELFKNTNVLSTDLYISFLLPTDKNSLDCYYLIQWIESFSQEEWQKKSNTKPYNESGMLLLSLNKDEKELFNRIMTEIVNSFKFK